MGLELALQRLQVGLKGLRDALADLRVTIAEDCPVSSEVALVDQFENSAIDLMGLVEEALGAIGRDARTIHPFGRAAAVRDSLLLAHRRLNQVEREYRNKLVAYDSICSLRRLGRERGGEWRSWGSAVKEAIEHCAAPLDNAHDGIRECWEEGTDGGLVFNGPMAHSYTKAESTDSTEAITVSKGRQDS
jgi:hypothetical protein